MNTRVLTGISVPRDAREVLAETGDGRENATPGSGIAAPHRSRSAAIHRAVTPALRFDVDPLT
ncbi:hypothetical protein [Burkholderia lata]|uniref:hypothetical protein n=1 Tax=Burkholderia lata (strain ATCC 17760 / DSM 23089 / LMG 22485 / NCIMB 9086 / R18194 / 383) TaxID=482957 RepID=UPI001583D321|nr:hypothetical protein [Burkholderia lata]